MSDTDSISSSLESSEKQSVAKERVRSRSKNLRIKKSKLSFNVPKEIYENALEQINNYDHFSDQITEFPRPYCHGRRGETTQALNPNHTCFILESAKHALEDRNWKAIYEIVNKALESRLPSVIQQLYEVRSENFNNFRFEY
jgi:hypothetical protein